MKVTFEGVYPALTTKFKEDLSLDIETFLKNVKAQVDAGVHGLIIGGSLGEASTLKDDERLILVRETVQFTENQVPVLLNVAKGSTADAMELVRKGAAAGAHGFMLLPPMNYKSSEDETTAYFREIAGSTDLPFLLYNNPVDYKVGISIAQFENLSDVDNIAAVKESTRDVTNITRMKNSFGDRFKILCGVDTLAFESLTAGADGWVAGLVCAFPQETVNIYEWIKNGQITKALKLYRWFMPLLELDIHPKLVQYIKMAEAATGLGTEIVRPPRLRVTGDERKKVESIISKALAHRPNL